MLKRQASQNSNRSHRSTMSFEDYLKDKKEASKPAKQPKPKSNKGPLPTGQSQKASGTIKPPPLALDKLRSS